MLVICNNIIILNNSSLILSFIYILEFSFFQMLGFLFFLIQQRDSYLIFPFTSSARIASRKDGAFWNVTVFAKASAAQLNSIITFEFLKEQFYLHPTHFSLHPIKEMG